MNLLLPGLTAAYGAGSIWLLVRAVNHPERWTNPAVAVVFGLPMLYVLSFGPVCWLVGESQIEPATAAAFYQPLVRLAAFGPEPVSTWLKEWCSHGQWGSYGLSSMYYHAHVIGPV